MEDSTVILDTLSGCFLHHPDTRSTTFDPVFKYRLHLCRVWGILADSAKRILDVGCGQGESSVVFAYVVGPQGHITGIDPAPPTYGGPFTLKQSQDFIRQSDLGDRITFIHDTVPNFFANSASNPDAGLDLCFDAATFCHSLWYFSDRDTVAQQFAALAAARVPRICLAEYACQAGSPEQKPHELAARMQIRFHQMKSPQGEMKDDDPNIRGALMPSELLEIARSSGWKLRDSGVVRPPPEMRDGYWESHIVLSPAFHKRVLSASLGTDQETNIMASISEIRDTVDKLKKEGKPLATMDVFWAVLELEA